MSKQILFGKNARDKIMVGVNAVANAVSGTCGPKGRNVIFDRGFGGAQITNDGVTIAREVVLKDPMENIGCQIAKEAAEKTNNSAGDGTTTATILMQSIVEQGMNKLNLSLFQKFLRLLSLKSPRINAIGMKNGIDKASKIAISYIKSISKQIKTDEEILQVASISAESNEIGQIIMKTIKELGVDSVITVEESNLASITSEVTNGMSFERGFISPYFMTDKARGEAELKNPFILVTDFKISSIDTMIPILEKVMKSGKRDFVIICEDITNDALNTFIINKLQGTINILGIKNPGFGLRKLDYLQDISIITGSKFISSDINKLEEVELSDLGSAEKVVSTREKTTIVGGKGTKEAIDERIIFAKKEVEGLQSKHDILKVEERIARLSGGVAIIKVGGNTEIETKYLKLKVEDAVSAVKSALEEGVVPGGGSSLLGASRAVVGANKYGYTKDELVGVDILVKALLAPLKQIAKNAGHGDGSKVLKKVIKMKQGGGYDALNDKYVVDLIANGIVDPAKVERCAIENAASSGGTLITLECALAEEPKLLPTGM